MKHLHDSHYVFIEPVRPAFPFLIVLGVLVVVVELCGNLGDDGVRQAA